MTNTEAAEEIQKAIDLIRQDGKDWLDERDIPILEMAINALTKEAWKEEHPVSPLLQKPALTAQPETHDKRTETHTCDCIERQAVYNVLDKMPIRGFKKDGETIHGLISLSQVNSAIINLPSAQPETCDDPRADIYYLAEKIGIHRLYALVVELRGEPEPCKDVVKREDVQSIAEKSDWFESSDSFNDFMCALYELPSAQPDMSGYSDKLWKAAYERGKAEAQQRWIPFKRRKPTEEEGTAFDYIMDCKCPEDGQNILVSINIQGHEPVQYDTFYGGGGEECCLESGYELVEEAIAWMPLPEPYAERRTDG